MATLSQLIARASSDNQLSNLLESNKFGIYAASTYLACDGVVDDYADLYSLINTTINGEDAEIWFKDSTCLISTNITIPSNVKLVFLNGGMLKPSSGVTITGSGARIEAGFTQIFDLSDSGIVAGTWKVKEWIPQWFGAVGDGSTVDSDAINNTVYAIKQNGGGRLYFPTTPTNIYLATLITLNACSDITITSDIGVTIKVPDNTDYGDNGSNVYANCFYIYGSSSNILIENITIDGNKSNLNYTVSGYAGDGTAHCILLSSVDNIRLSNVNMKDAGTDCIKSASVTNMFVDNCIFDGGRRQGWSFTGTHANIFVNSSVFKNVSGGISPSAGVDIEPNGALDTNENIIFNACSFIDNYRGAIIVRNATDVKFLGCRFEEHEYTLGGLCIGDSGNPNSVKHVSAIGCTFKTTNNSRSVYIDSADYVIIADNTFDECSTSTYDIDVNTSTFVQLSKNIHRKPLVAVNIATDCSYIKMDGNMSSEHQGSYAFIVGGDYISITNNLQYGGTGNSFRIFSDQNKFTYIGNITDLAVSNHSSATATGARVEFGNSGPSFQKTSYSSSQPTTGTFEIGHIVFDSTPTSGQYIGWTCTVAGTEGTLNSGATTGNITTGTATLTVNSASGLTVGCYITIAGVTGVKKVTAISGTTITINSNSDATVTGAAVAFSNATFKTFGAIS